ncbi:MAG: flavodoxin domain-containing protein [Bacteroidetes bacterium]|nr:flavodoxin domain-containing protein [Bacteroidota bacterium]
MEKRVLVAYATKYGAAAEIAKKIGQILNEAGYSAEVLSVERVADLKSYQAVVLGSSVYIGQWRKKASRFLKRNIKVLSEKSVWLFSCGLTGKDESEDVKVDWNFPKALQPVADQIQPRDITLFLGKVDLEKLNPLEKMMFKNAQGSIGDFRDWDLITSWAGGIVKTLNDE